MNQKDFICLKEALEKKKKILVSSCLLGMKINYEGKAHPIDQLRQLFLQGQAIPICPEVLANLPIPRDPAEIVMVNGERKVYNKKELDVTEDYRLGAQRTLDTARTSGAKLAIMKSNSPSCGCGKIYDGTFGKNLIDGDGITVALLKENGVRVITEADFLACLK
ncbi:DUF523 domain-containing protein [Acetobacterium woodii]|uniref:Uncharacterized protein n=1 Tax=Acetobacterium woodii (strain ATCC 29683 / DSM 1030 / JCM 2381 / KCTC 1655 / WB1) TaxID=931626 RepID=H6LH25_ACEWD|nr:DUF523 domain-containing protein [Acetobacterium woodii]AFA47163.1 hypothetical protein Awo_c03620 [Acetobacterium woodii DSM 1030]